MRRHPERDGHFYNPRANLGLSERARFCVAITGAAFLDGIYGRRAVYKVYSGKKVITQDMVNEARVLSLALDRPLSLRNLSPGERYVTSEAHKVTIVTKIHSQNDGIDCKPSNPDRPLMLESWMQ